ncbi:MAG: hypothetical protein ABI758_05065 [Candidatus Woesebacteria bacterium]
MIESIKRLLIGTDEYRKREKELGILSSKDYIPKTGGVFGLLASHRDRKNVSQQQVESSLRKRDRAVENLPPEAHSDFDQNI